MSTDYGIYYAAGHYYGLCPACHQTEEIDSRDWVWKTHDAAPFIRMLCEKSGRSVDR